MPKSTPTPAAIPAKFPRVTHRDIAKEAGVSRVTVSLVLAGKDQTSEETRKRVLEAAKRLRYRPNLLVHGMQTGRTNTIGLLVPSSLQFQGRIAHGIHDELIESDFVPIQLMVTPPRGNKTDEIEQSLKPSDATDIELYRARELEQIHRLVDRRVDGMIVWPADTSVPDVHFREIWQRNIPLVTVDRETTTHADHVGTDEELGGRLAAEHLLSLGHRRLAVISYPDRPGPIARRRDAFVMAVQAAGASAQAVMIPADEMTAQITALLARPDRPTAVFCVTDEIAIKAYHAASKAGLAVPQKLSVVGYADFSYAGDLTPPLTTVKQDPYEMGRTAAKLLLDRVLDRAESATPRHVYIKPALIVRESTARPS